MKKESNPWKMVIRWELVFFAFLTLLFGSSLAVFLHNHFNLFGNGAPQKLIISQDRRQEGHATQVTLPKEDTATFNQQINIRVYENGVPLERTSYKREVISDLEGGKFWIKNRSLWFTAQNCSDPKNNGNIYTYRTPHIVPGAISLTLYFSLLLCYSLFLLFHKRLSSQIQTPYIYSTLLLPIILWKNFKGRLDNLLLERTSGLGLGLFRILFGILILAEALQIFYFREILFVHNITCLHLEISTELYLSFWLATICCIIIGLGTRIASIVNFAIISLANVFPYHYHHDYLIKGASFLFLFTSIGHRLSIDALIRDKKKSPSKPLLFENYLLVFIGLALVYWDSIFHKLTSPMWMNGLGAWMPSSIPPMTWINPSILLDHEYLVKALGYGTLLFEFIFIFALFYRRAHWLLITIGVGLHLGITLIYPIPLFGLGAASLYILLIPDAYLRGLFKQFSNPDYTIKSTANESTSIKRQALLFIFWTSIFFQTFSLSLSPLVQKAAIRFDLIESWNSLSHRILPITNFTGRYFGITPHGVFMDWHFKDRTYFIAATSKNTLTKEEEWIPLLNSKGQASWYNTGRLWVHNTFAARASSDPSLNLKALQNIKDILWLWSNKKRIDPENTLFTILAKELDPIKDTWTRGFYKKQLDKPWIVIGNAQWKEKEIVISLHGNTQE